MTNISKNLFICLSTHLSIEAIECFLTESRPYFWVFEPIDVRHSVNIIIFGRFSQTNLMLRNVAQRLIEAFLINNRFSHLLIFKVTGDVVETLDHMLSDL